MHAARKLGIGGATFIGAAEGYGHEKKLRSTRFFELTGQPIEVGMALSAVGAERLLPASKQRDSIFFIHSPHRIRHDSQQEA